MMSKLDFFRQNKKHKEEIYISLKELKFESFYDFNAIPQKRLKFAVIVSKYKGKLVFVKHKKRDTFEIPGGTREPREHIDKTAKRELIEETGAKRFKIEPVAIYGIKKNDYRYFGKLFYAEIFEFGVLPNMEIREVTFFDKTPENLTYPLIQPHILNKIEEYIKSKQ